MTIGRPLKFFYYAVAVGRKPGIYHSQKCMMKEVDGFEGAVYAKLPTAKDATAFVDQYNKKPNRYYTNSKYLINPYRKITAPDENQKMTSEKSAVTSGTETVAKNATKKATKNKSTNQSAEKSFAKVFEDEKKAQQSAPITQTSESKPRFIWN